MDIFHDILVFKSGLDRKYSHQPSKERIGSEEPLAGRGKKMKEKENVYEKCLNLFEFV